MSVKDFFGLNELPFNNSPDIKFFYKSKEHEEIIKRLVYAIENNKGLVTVIGQIGTGKTTLARLILDEFDTDSYEVALIIVVHSEVTSEWILKKLLMQLGVDEIPTDKPSMLSKLYQKLSSLMESGKKVVIMFDEAQMLKNKDVMEELRGILNFETETGKLINFVLFGMPELEDNLRLDEPLKQRVAMRFLLKPFDLQAVKVYIEHRLKVAGAKKIFFSDNAIKGVYRHSGGIPRVINTICDNAMFEAYLVKSETIDEKIIEQVAVDLGL
jgi:type II secretory pathway predicted ATPase ExeA